MVEEAPPEPTPLARMQGQDFGATSPVFSGPALHPGHKSDSDSFTRSKNAVYKRKITRQKNRKKAQ